MFLHILKFNPYHDEHGRFTYAGHGQGIEFVSPNVDNLPNVRVAQEAIGSLRHREVVAANAEVDRILGLTVEQSDGVGAWFDGAEDTVMARVRGDPSYDTLRLAAAMKGMIADQKAVIPFKVTKDGPDSLYQVKVGHTDLPKIHDELVAMGLENNTLIPHGDHTDVYLFDPGTQMEAHVNSAGEHYGQRPTRWRGNGEFLGSENDRTEGRQKYQETIDALLGSDRKGPWDRLYSRWRETHPVLKEEALTFAKVLKFNYHHWPAGSAGGKGGQFAPKGTEGAVEERLTHEVQTLAEQNNQRTTVEGALESIRQQLGQEAMERIKAMQERADYMETHGLHTNEMYTTDANHHRYTAERRALHNQVLATFKVEMERFRVAPGATPLLTVMGGRGGSGKGWLDGNAFNRPGEVPQYRLDPDKIKEVLARASPEGWNPKEVGRWHAEGDVLLSALVKYARHSNINLALDLTLKSDKAQWLHTFRKAGYDVQGVYMHLPPQIAVVRAAKRALREDGRFVPLSVIVGGSNGGGNYNNEKNFDRLIGKIFNRGYAYYQNLGQHPVLVKDTRRKP